MGVLKKHGASSGVWGMEVENYYISTRKKTVPEYQMTAEHLHKYYEMVFNFSHIPISHTAAGRHYTSETPCILFRAPYVLHSINTTHTYTRTVLMFHPCILNEYGNVLSLGRLRGRKEFLLPCTGEQMEYLDQLLTRMQRIGERGKSNKPWFCLLGALLDEVGEMLPEDPAPEEEMPAYIQELLLHVVDNPGEDLSTDALAKKFFVGHTKLAKDFSAAVGITLHEYVSEFRVAQAKRWLNEDLPIDVVAARCGFTQESSFIRMFRRRVGLTPGEYRNRCTALL